MQAVTDEQLIDWVAKGDPSCLGTLFERHHKAVYKFCLQMTRNPQQAGVRIGTGGPMFTISSMNGDIRIQKTP